MSKKDKEFARRLKKIGKHTQALRKLAESEPKVNDALVYRIGDIDDAVTDIRDMKETGFVKEPTAEGRAGPKAVQ